MFPAHPWLSVLIGYTIAALASRFVVGPTIGRLWSVAEADLNKKNISIPRQEDGHETMVRAAPLIRELHGVTEVWLYASCVVLEKPEGIAVWLAFKAIQRWRATEKEDARHISGSLIYMIGTALNIFVGVVCGWLATTG